ncbi:MAG: hypothetical protein APF77_12685 [Clostridia bacterium BRH_c25]|nr:MAG: hypothetical protein APF77_12685 [Clostridia bacterium BRH_c25]
MEINRVDAFTEWTNWKNTLSKAVNLGETVGMSDNTIENIAVKVGNVLSARVDPENGEQRLLQELWKVGDDSDRKILAKLIVKMVETDVKQ